MDQTNNIQIINTYKFRGDELPALDILRFIRGFMQDAGDLTPQETDVKPDGREFYRISTTILNSTVSTRRVLPEFLVMKD